MTFLISCALIGAIIFGAILMTALFRPNLYLALYLVSFTHFFGLVNFNSIEVEGLININLFFNLITIIAVISSFFLHSSVRRRGWGMLLIISLFFIFGLLFPVINEHSALKHAFIDGKDFLFYGLLAYLLAYTDHIDRDQLNDTILYICVGLAAALLMAVAFGIQVPGYSLAKAHIGVGSGVRIISPVILLLGLFICSYRIKTQQNTGTSIAIGGIILAAAAIQEHRSIFLVSITAVPAYMLYTARFRSIIKVLTVICLSIVLLFLTLGENKLYTMTIKPIYELLSSEGAMEGRDTANRIRWDMIDEHPMLGHGFIDEKSTLGRELYSVSKNRFDQSLGTVDSGYVDILVRFGAIGMSLFALMWLMVVIPSLLKREQSLALAGSFFLTACFAVNITLSVFTYATGIPMICIATYWILSPISYKKQRHDSTNNS